MDDAWRIKCGSPWRPPASSSPSPAQPSAAPQLLVPPPIVAASQVLPPASGNQMDVYSHQRCYPFISREANMENHSFIQDPVGFSSLNTGSCKTSKTEMDHSFLALLSGSSHPLASDFVLSKLGSSLSTSKLPPCDIGNVANGVDFSVSAPYVAAVSVNYGSNNAMANGSEHLSSYPMGRLPMISSNNQSTISCNEFQVLGSQFPSSNAGRLIISQAHQGTERGLTVPSTSNINASQQQKSNALTYPIKQVDASMNTSSHASSFIRGCPRVFCRDKVGELFVSDNGLLGVFCLCHSFRMSVAKFCEHSGLHTVNPGDAVYLENGETVAQWRRLFFLNIGFRVPDDGSGWDWPDGTFILGSLGRPMGNNLLKPNYAEAFQLQEPLSEIGRSDGLPSGHVSRFPYAGTTALEKLLNRFQENAENRSTLEEVHIGSICSTSSIPVNEQMLKGKENHSFVSPSILKHALATEQQNGVNKLIVHNASAVGKAGNFSTLYPSPGPAKSFASGTNSSRTHISSNFHLMDKDSTSKIELRLGQPSHQNHDFIMSNTAAMCPQQFLDRFGLQKKQAHHSISQGSVLPIAPEKTMQSLYHTPSQVSTSSGNFSRLACGNVDSMHISEQVVNAEADKNSLISLFLSHFSTSGRKVKSCVGEKLISRSENVVPSLVDHNSPSAKCSMIDFSRNVNNGIEAKSNMRVAECPSHMEKRKGMRVSFEDEFYTGKNCSYIQNKQIGDLRVFAELSDGYYSHNIPSSDRQNSACFHQSFSRLLEEPDARHSSECGQMSFLANRDTHDDAVLRCRNARTGSLLPSLANSFSSSNPIYVSGPTSSLSNKKNANVTQNLVDENMGFPALNHVLKLSKQKHLPASIEMNDQGRQSCCSSAMGTMRKGSKENLIACDDLKHNQHCSGLQEASNIAFRSVHSCCSCRSCSFAENLTSKTCTAGSSRACSQTGCIHDSKLYSKETHVKSPCCHLCNDDEQSVLRRFRTDNKIAELAEYEVFNQKDGNSFIPGKCSCSVHMKCLKGCHYRGEGPSGFFKEHGACAKSHTFAPAYDLEHPSQDGKKISLGQFDGSGHVNMNDNCQSAFGRDVPCRALGNSDSVIVQDGAEMLPAIGCTDYLLTENAAKDFDGTCEEIDSRKEQQISSIYSACSAPVITEISTEVNNLDSCTGGTGICRSSFDPAIDEGSVIEKCGSSDDVIDNTRWDETVTVKSKVDYQKVSDYASCHTSRNQTDETNHQSGEFIIEVNVGKSFIPRKKRNEFHAECTVKEGTVHREPITRGWRAERKKKATKWRRLDDSFIASGLSLIHSDSNFKGYLELQGSSDGLKVPDHPQNTTEEACASVTLNKSKGGKRKHCAMSSVESLPWGIWDDHHRVGRDDVQVESADYDSSNGTSKSSTGKKVKKNFRTCEKEESKEQKNNPEPTGKILKSMPTCTKGCLTGKKYPRERMVKPVVRGNLGIISIGSLSGKSKPVKIVSLSSVLKLAKRSNVSENEKEPGDTSELQMAYAGCFSSEGKTPEMSVTLREKDTGVGNLMPKSKSKTKPRGKETRKRRLSELTGNSEDTKDALCLPTSGESECSKLTRAGFYLKESLVMGAPDDLVGPKPQDRKGEMKPILKCSRQPHCRSGKVSPQSQDYAVELCQTSARKFPNKGRRCQLSLLDSDAFCCVCGSSNKDDANYLLECNNCLIRVHQACYGISKVPKGHWSCRPCRVNSKNIACVLCGYEGGAMTRAVRSRNIVKSLLKAWKEGRGYRPTRSAQAHTEDGARALSPSSKVHNSITAGALDQTITQWVHVVCGLWTPGTRCPNVDTMSAFDVSGAFPATRRMVCSMCNQPGGSCIQCRVVDCSIYFHPWCAHKKGLLQSETEGVENENVGFYGRCLLHATHHNYHSDGIPTDAGIASPRVKEFSCARTEGYKGRKKEHGLIHTFHCPSNDNGICSVPQEQLNAWLHINGQKSCTRGLLKPPTCETDYDCRKEYARYKQMKGWKHLVVYKSRIHALGLYTSQFISQGAMVVEYVGEIVGLRVADKREIEYQSGKKLQYKSACYFFRIDKEHIIDATRKGGIARFVNHSCLPNCVAKVISVKNEKKVVFFAERDINPGEEITYDYHFNHEEEGKKIPCFCNSRNCRRYLN